MVKIEIIALFSLVLLLSVNGQINIPDRVISWPQWGNYPQNTTYSGYLAVDPLGLRQIHYVFLESLNDLDNVEDEPILIWLNGGPGCSSMLGLLQENGPYVLFGDNENFINNTNYTWNNFASVLYLETPPGVGFSVNNDPNYVFNDTNTANDTLTAILNFFNDQPGAGYKSNPLYITGESYAGMYIPYLAQAMLNYNIQQQATVLNLTGIMIGNGVFLMDDNVLNNYTNFMYDSHYQFGPELGPIFINDCQKNPEGVKCAFFNYKANQQMLDTDPYDIYAYTYPGDSSSTQAYALHKKLGKMKERLQKLKEGKVGSSGIGPNFIMEQYLNNATVQQAIHVNQFNIQWTDCNNTINQLYQSSPDSMWIYPQLFKFGLKILIYSGDIDAVVPFFYTEYYMNQVNKENGLTNSSEFLQWTTQSGQVGGWSQAFQKWEYCKVRAAGHEVPMYQHEAAYDMLKRFLFGIN